MCKSKRHRLCRRYCIGNIFKCMACKRNIQWYFVRKNWLYAICKNKIIDHFRKQAGNSSIVVGTEEALYFDDTAHWKRGETTPKDWNIDYNKKVEVKEFYVALENCKRKLKDIQQHVFVMKFMEDMDAPSICKILNITTAYYWVLIHRCKLHLRACLEKNWLKM